MNGHSTPWSFRRPIGGAHSCPIPSRSPKPEAPRVAPPAAPVRGSRAWRLPSPKGQPDTGLTLSVIITSRASASNPRLNVAPASRRHRSRQDGSGTAKLGRPSPAQSDTEAASAYWRRMQPQLTAKTTKKLRKATNKPSVFAESVQFLLKCPFLIRALCHVILCFHTHRRIDLHF
jgi:hypothetical protein